MNYIIAYTHATKVNLFVEDVNLQEIKGKKFGSNLFMFNILKYKDHNSVSLPDPSTVVSFRVSSTKRKKFKRKNGIGDSVVSVSLYCFSIYRISNILQQISTSTHYKNKKRGEKID